MSSADSQSTSVKVTRASKLAASLKRSILLGQMKPGAKVSLDQLRDQFQVSLSPLREAASRLVSSGLIQMQDQRGYRVAPVSVSNFNEVTALRISLEAQAVRASIFNADLDWESAVLGALHRVNRQTGAPGAMASAERDFHLALIANCRMPILMDSCKMLFDLNLRYDHLFGAGLPAGDTLADERREIANAAIARDTDLAADLLGRHIGRRGATLAQIVAAALSEPAITVTT